MSITPTIAGQRVKAAERKRRGDRRNPIRCAIVEYDADTLDKLEFWGEIDDAKSADAKAVGKAISRVMAKAKKI